jgi:hypothetical protein
MTHIAACPRSRCLPIGRHRTIDSAVHARLLLALLLSIVAACSDDGGSGCPMLDTGGIVAVEGMACSTSPDVECFARNSFSMCESAWYRCVGGKFHMERTIDAFDGHACSDSPLTSCTYEGNPSCNAEPYAQACSCGSTGTWRCTCSCYDGRECPMCPDAPMPGVSCGPEGNTCSYPGQTCRCTSGAFVCS